MPRLGPYDHDRVCRSGGGREPAAFRRIPFLHEGIAVVTS